ncbi:MAG: hypothetical protein ABIR36_06105, partial [Nitrospiraceae bacterium]
MSTIAVVADQSGNESLILVGEKDALGQPVSLTEIYYSALGKDLKIEMGSDGLPSVISDQIGNKFSFTNYTASTVDITFFDQDGQGTVGPSTISLNSAKLALLKNASSPPQQASVAAGIQLARDDVRLVVDIASTAVGLVGCGLTVVGAVAAFASAVATPVGVALGAAALAMDCGPTLADSAGLIF